MTTDIDLNKEVKAMIMRQVSPETLAFIKDRERRAFEAGQNSVCSKCGDTNCPHNKHPSDFGE